MCKIGEFSTLAKTTVKTLRYYEKEGLLIPKLIQDNGYRYYEAVQLLDLARIISLRQVGLSIEEIKRVIRGANLEDILVNRKNGSKLFDGNLILSKALRLLKKTVIIY